MFKVKVVEQPVDYDSDRDAMTAGNSIAKHTSHCKYITKEFKTAREALKYYLDYPKDQLPIYLGETKPS